MEVGKLGRKLVWLVGAIRRRTILVEPTAYKSQIARAKCTILWKLKKGVEIPIAGCVVQNKQNTKKEARGATYFAIDEVHRCIL